jgi:hypothetical protein
VQPLITLAQAKNWLQIATDQTNDDTLLGMLCSTASDFFLLLTDRQSIVQQSYTERLNGTGTGSIVPSNTPIVSISALSVDGRSIPASSGFGQPGYFFDDDSITITGGGVCFPWSPGGIPGSFPRGKGNVSITYVGGFANVQATEAFAVPGTTPFTYTLLQASTYVGSLMVTYASSGDALTLVSGAPNAGQYNFNAGVLTLAAADAGASLIATYMVTNIPPAIQQCVMEMVGWAYKNRDRIGITTQSFPQAGLNNTYSQAPLSPMSTMTVKKYRRKIMPWS